MSFGHQELDRIEAFGVHFNNAIGANVSCDSNLERQRHGEHEAIVVVGVFADQVDATGSSHDQAWFSIEGSAEGMFCSFEGWGIRHGVRWVR